MTRDNDDNFVTQWFCAEIQSTQNRNVNEYIEEDFYAQMKVFLCNYQ
jgi:hypothetical protein